VELRQLEHFVAVADDGQFTRAAARLHIVQSGLSASIRSLERQLGARLFVRTTHRVELTEAGRALLPEARRTLSAAAAARDSVAAVQGLVAGAVTVGTMQFLHVVDIPAVLGRFHAAHPAVDIRLRQGGAAAIVDQVRSGQLDLALTSLPGPPPPGVELIALGEDPLVVVCPEGHALARRDEVDLARLTDETFIEFPADWGPRVAVDRVFAAARLERTIGFEINDVATMLALVAHGLGIGFVPGPVAEKASGVSVIRIRRRRPTLRYSIAVPVGGPANSAGRALLAAVQAHDRRS
jgi:DNA-binding transcriptional LysR family regulator